MASRLTHPVRVVSMLAGRVPSLARLACAVLLSVFLSVLVSPGLSRRVPHYEVGQYTSATIRAPYDFTVPDEAETARKRDDAAQRAPAVVTLDDAIQAGIRSRVASAFATVAAAFVEADAIRLPAQDQLRRLSVGQQSALKRRKAIEADRLLSGRLEESLPRFQEALGVTLAPSAKKTLARERFSPNLTQAVDRLVEDLYTRPIVSDAAQIQRLLSSGGAGRIVVRDPARGTDRIVTRAAAFCSLEEAVASVPERADVVASDLAADTRRELARIVQAQLRPNAMYDRAASEARRAEAVRAVLPVSLVFRRNQLIVGEGQEVTPQTVLVLRHLEARRLPSAFAWRLAGASLLFFLLMFSGARLAHAGPPLADKDVAFLATGLGLWAGLFWAWLFVADRVVAADPRTSALAITLLFPVAGASMLTRFVLGLDASVLQLLVWAVAAGLLGEGSVGFAAYVLVVGLASVYVVGGCNDRACLVRAGIRVAGVAASAAIVLGLLQGLDAAGVLLAAASGTAGTAVSGLVVVALAPAAERLFGYTTRINLLEMVSYEHPLLKRLMIEAPGTFQHSVNIGVLADAAATAVGADALLTRVGALYHDVGKIRNRELFIENQLTDNPHATLAPSESARLIAGHVAEGVALVHAYRLGERIADFVREHHGTRSIEFFLHRAREAGLAIDPREFAYPGPRPRSRETAILMIADQVEAISRTMPEGGADEFLALTAAVVERLGREGQFDEAPLTLADLDRIRHALVAALVGMHHRRIQYPSQSSA